MGLDYLLSYIEKQKTRAASYSRVEFDHHYNENGEFRYDNSIIFCTASET
jgi:hypothetical protein